MVNTDECRKARRYAPGHITSIEILCVGTELLMGQIINTNAAFLAGELMKIGIPSYYQTVVGDNKNRLESAIRLCLNRSDTVIMTGGLGPTADDITMEIAAKSVGISLEFHQESADKIRSYFSKLHHKMASSNLKQAMLPKGCIPLVNNSGTAPGAIIETGEGSDEENTITGGKTLILLPGPPNEMQCMFKESVESYLASRAPVKIHSKFIRLFGIGESQAESIIRDLIDNQTNPTIAPYCSEGECMFRISYTQKQEQEQEQEYEYEQASAEPDEQILSNLINTVKERLGEYIYEIGDRNMPHVVFDLLNRAGKTVSFAESCTAGLATSMLAAIPGASAILTGSIVAYNNSVKEKILGVPHSVLSEYGAVSEQVAEAMAAGCRKVIGTDYAVAITGIAGPDGGTGQKPVGAVYVSLAGPRYKRTMELHIAGNRSRIRYVASLHAFDLLRRTIINDCQ